MLLLDAALRISAITMLLLTAVLALRDAWHLIQSKIAAALCVSLSAMFINTMPEVLAIAEPAKSIVWSMHTPNIALIWLFALALYEDDFKMNRWHWAVPIALFINLHLVELIAAVGSGWYILPGLIINRILGFGVLVHLLWVAISGRSDDLVEARRRTRLWFIIGIAITAILILTGETAHSLFVRESYDPEWLSTLRTAVAWPMILFGTLWFTRLPAERFLFDPPQPSARTAPSIDPKDASMHKKLIESMDEGAYTEAGLTIGVLAENIAVPEHQLRALINQGLGYRNFSAFLNSYRIQYAKEALSDPEQARLPILTIAMDAGYNSLAPFNRAFKAAEGVTPTEYRRRALANPDRN